MRLIIAFLVFFVSNMSMNVSLNPELIIMNAELRTITIFRILNSESIIAKVENIGVEPMTSCVQGRRSSQLS